MRSPAGNPTNPQQNTDVHRGWSSHRKPQLPESPQLPADLFETLSETCFLTEISENNQTEPQLRFVFCKDIKHIREMVKTDRPAYLTAVLCALHTVAAGRENDGPKLEMLGSIVSRLASPRKKLGEKKIWGKHFFKHSGWHETSRNR